jgi:hypothetical protein
MASTIQRTFRLPVDVAERLSQKENATEYVVATLRERMKRDEDEAFAASLECLVGDEDVQAIHEDFDKLQRKVMARIDD